MRVVILAAAGALVVAIAGLAAWLGFAERPAELSPSMVNVQGADIGGPFELTGQDGKRVTSDQLIDGPTLIYFGYTFCPDVCPVDTQIMAQAVDILDEQGIDVTPVFITVDPERDTPEALADYAEAVHPKLRALTGTPEEIQTAADAYKVFYQKVEMPESAVGYLMNHTSYFYLMVPGEGLVALFRRGVTPESLAADIARVLAAV
jgi:protein SCO1